MHRSSSLSSLPLVLARLVVVAIPFVSIVALGPASRADIVDDLLQDLASEDETTRSAAIEKLAKNRKRAVLERLERTLVGQADIRVKTGIIETYGAMGKRGVKSFDDLLKKTQGIQHSNILYAVGEVGPDAAWALPPLLSLLKRVKDDWKPGGRGKGSAGTPGAFLSRGAAILAIGKMGKAAEKALPSLEKLLEAESPYERVSAALAVWWIRGEREPSYAIFLEALELPKEELFATERAIYALGEMGSAAKDAVPHLEALREKSIQQTQNSIYEALDKIAGRVKPDGPVHGDATSDTK